MVELRYVTDPGCSWSWAGEPALRRLMTEFAGQLRITQVMGGLARDYTDGRGPEGGPWHELFQHFLEVSAETGAPIDPRLWSENPIRSTYPASMAVKAAAEVSADGGAGYLRGLREGLMCHRRRLDNTEALVAEAARIALDADAFRSALGSSATVEAFGADVEEARALAAEVPESDRERGVVDIGAGRERVTFPTAVLTGGAGERRLVAGLRPYQELRDAVIDCGAALPERPPPGVAEALRRFGRMTTSEVEVVCDLPGPRAQAELWRLAADWRVRPERIVTGWLWEPA